MYFRDNYFNLKINLYPIKDNISWGDLLDFKESSDPFFGKWCYCTRETHGQSLLRVGMAQVPGFVEVIKINFAPEQPTQLKWRVALGWWAIGSSDEQNCSW